MRCLCGSWPSATTRAPSPTPPTQPVQRLAPQRDSKVFAATSSAITPSIGAAFNDPRGTSSGGLTVQRIDKIRGTIYLAVRMAVDITKESSDLFPPLKAVVGAVSVLMDNYDRTSDNTKGVGDLEDKVELLRGVLASPVGEDDLLEKDRRVELRRRLDGVVAKLEPLSGEHALLKFLRNVDNAKTLDGFTQELDDAIKSYQVSLQQGTYKEIKDIRNETKNMLQAADLEILGKLKPVDNAWYQAGHHRKCLAGTRESVLKDLMLWAKNPQERNVYWLSGLAGTGKSTIAQSFSEAVAKEGLLGASFFCSKDYLDRKELKHIFPTLAYQLAFHCPHFQSHIISIIKGSPAIAHTSLITQLEKLLVNPLSGTNISCVIVIDALDECIDDEPSSAILSVLGQFVSQLSPVKFFITGRPEPRIRTGFRLPLLQPTTQVFSLHEVDLASVNKDIQLYLTERLTEIAKQRSDLDLPNPWPHDSEIKALTEKSSGLFIFASTMVEFIGSGNHNPDQHLQCLLSKENSTIYEGHTGIDHLYSQILQQAFSNVRRPEEFTDIRHVLGAIVLAFNPLSRRELSEILGIHKSFILTTLRPLHSVIFVPFDETEEIHTLHKSFPDFLQDASRCSDPRLCINPEAYHSKIAFSCLKLVKELKRNPCSLPPFTMNQDIQGLPQLLENKISGAVQYACTYWARHLRLSTTSPDFARQIFYLAVDMLNNAPPWIEVMSLKNQLGEVIHSMDNLLNWLEKATPNLKYTSIDVTNPHNLATDCLQLLMHFFHPIEQSAQQIYCTALPLSPTSSHLRKSCLQSVIDSQLSHVTAFIGAPSTWSLLLRTIDTRPRQLTSIITSWQRIIAACGEIVNIYDAVTGVLQQSLPAPGPVTKIQASPDGSTLFFAHSPSITMWDIQTGGLIHTFTTQPEVKDVALSTLGDHIASGSSDGSVRFWNTQTKREGEGFGNGQPVIAICWLSPQKIAVATQNCVYIRDIVAGKTEDLPISSRVWGMLCFGENEFLVGTSQPDPRREDREQYSFEFISYPDPPKEMASEAEYRKWKAGRKFGRGWRSLGHPRELARPTVVGREIACITPPTGVQPLSTESYDWTKNPPLLDAATSVVVSLNRNLVVQTGDSIQIFSADVLASREVRNNTLPSHVYSLGKKYILCVLQPTRRLTLLESETLQELRPDDDTLPFGSFLPNQPPSARPSFCPGLVANLDISAAMQAWQSGTPLPRQIEIAKDTPRPLYGLSPACTKMVTIHSSSRWELCVDAKCGGMLAVLPLEDDDLGSGEVYDITFDSETRFYLKIDGPGQHVQIPYDITASPSEEFSHTITKGESVPLSGPRAAPPYTLDANCEWVLDAQSRKICWISPGDLRRGDGGHFWAGSSLVMVGDDGAVKKISFKEPDC